MDPQTILVFGGLALALIALLIGGALLAARSESTADDSAVLKILDALISCLPFVGAPLSRGINTTPSQRKKENR